MSPTHTYEVHVLRGHDWIIDSVYESREDALRDARAVVAGNPQASVQLIEERFDPRTGASQETVVFRAQPADKGSATFKHRPARSGAARAADSGFKLSPALLTALAIAAAFAAGLLVGLGGA